MNLDDTRLGSLLHTAAFHPPMLNTRSAWIGHLPFAGWIVGELKPRTIVELGSHFGHSYFAFCQSVLQNGFSTKCHAVDTWKGDDHAGVYGDAVYQAVSAFNDANFKAFSTLMRMTFDDAASRFDHGTVDLLHIDGLHTYEAVRHDFETWLPKLSKGAVVLFHDTEVKDRDFGVWKFWEELGKEYPNNILFTHSFGLGVLQLNNAPKSKKIPWLDKRGTMKPILADYFKALGTAQMFRCRLHDAETRLAAMKGRS